MQHLHATKPYVLHVRAAYDPKRDRPMSVDIYVDDCTSILQVPPQGADMT